MASTETGAVPDSEPEPSQARLMAIEARLKALEEAEDNAAWGRTAASRGGFRQERDNLLCEAEGIRAKLD